MNSLKKYRHIATVLVFLSIIFLPYWLYLPVLLSAIIVFSFYWEGVFLAFLIDVLYGQGVESFAHLFSPMAFGAMMVVIFLLPMRKHLRVNV